jgi:hypothetical protein
MDPLPGSGSPMRPATRHFRPSRGIALLLVGAVLALLAVLGGRTTSSAELVSAHQIGSESEAGAPAAVAPQPADEAQRRVPRRRLITPTSLVVAVLVLAAAVVTGLRHTITSLPDAGRATSGLRPPPLLRA